MSANEDAALFMSPLKPEDHGVSSEAYDKAVKQPMDLSTITAKLNADPSLNNAYKSPSAFSKDVNRIFTNVIKLWEPGQEIADAARRLQSWWMEQWTMLVPRLMNMTPDNDKEIIKDGNASSEDDGMNCAFVHNERGEDYQEQIGMPDEENMRHWSHHHTSDTVDDPVFRAAMRGFDTVSFVFGLEVTWSLIQQRQQEEEEKQAMQELECMQEIVEDEDEDVAADTVAADTVAADTVAADTVATDTVATDTVATDTTAEELMQSSGDKKLTCKTLNDEKNDQVDEAGTPTTEATHFSDSENDDSMTGIVTQSFPEEKKIEDDSNVVASTPPTQKEIINENKRASSPDDVWACNECTFENEASSRSCGMCGLKRSPKKRKH